MSTNRIAIETGRLRVSKPGFDVFTCGPGGLVFDSNLGESLGVYLTGTGSVPAATSRGKSDDPSAGPADKTGETEVYFSQPAGTIPLAFLQADEGGGKAWGGGYRHVWHLASDPEWVNPNDYDIIDGYTYGYSGNPGQGVVLGLGSGVLYVENYRGYARNFRYVIFFARLV